MHTVQLGKEWFSEQSGGLNRYYAELTRRLPDVGVGVTGLVAGSDQVAARSAGIVRAFAPRQASLPARLAGVRAHTRRALSERKDGLHPNAHSPRAGDPVLLVAHFALYAAPCLDLLEGKPLVVHFQGPWAAESQVEGAGRLATRLKHWLEQRVYRRASRFIVLSRAFGGVLDSLYSVGIDRIRVIPGGVDTQRFTPTHPRAEARRLLGWPRDRPTVLVVRRLVRRMGLEDLVASVKHARAAVPDILVHIAGTGPLARELEARAAAEGVSDSVRLLGFVPDEQLPLAYQAADVSIVPSVALEGFGLIVAESLASGTPVLVTAVGGLPETIEDLAPQCVIRERGPQALAAALVDALTGACPLPAPDACVEYARERFAWPVVADQVRAVYAEAVS